MRRTRFPVVLSIAFMLGLPSAFSGLVSRPDPDGSWAYSKMPANNADIMYYPTSESEFASAVFQHYTTYSEGAEYHGWFAPSPNPDTGFHIFTTYAKSTVDQDIFFISGGDDGHSVFVDHAFVAGGGFGVNVYGTISLKASVWHEITLAGHNAGGVTAVNFFTRGSLTDPYTTLEETPGISINAVPEPSTVPEIDPAGFGSVLALVTGALGLFERRRRQA